MNKIFVTICKLFGSTKKLPKEYVVPNPFEIPAHVQKDVNNCTSIAVSSMIEYKLSIYFNERVLIDIDDLWEKQKKFGTATENGDTLKDVFVIADEYGVLFKTESGKTGLFKPAKGIEML